MKDFRFLVSIGFLSWVLGSCRAPGCLITEADSIHDTCFVQKVRTDSVCLKDSVWVYERMAGDTVYLTTDRWHVQYKERVSHDSIYIHLRDTVVRTIPVEVEKRKSIWEEVADGFGYMLIGGILALVGMALFCFYRGK